MNDTPTKAQVLLQTDQPSLLPGVPAFVLVDPLSGDIGPMATVPSTGLSAHELQARRSQAWERAIYACPAPAGAGLGEHEHPYLIALDGPEDAWLQWAVEHSELERQEAMHEHSRGFAPHALAGLLQSPRDPQALARDLTNAFVLHAPARPPAHYLRLADRRTLAWALQLAGPERLLRCMPHLASWRYQEADGLWMLLHQLTSDAPADLLRWSGAEWHELALGAWLHPAVAQQLGRQSGSSSSTAEANSLRQAARTAWHLLQTVFRDRPAAFATDADRRAALQLQLSASLAPQKRQPSPAQWLQALQRCLPNDKTAMAPYTAQLEKCLTATATSEIDQRIDKP